MKNSTLYYHLDSTLIQFQRKNYNNNNNNKRLINKSKTNNDIIDFNCKLNLLY